MAKPINITAITATTTYIFPFDRMTSAISTLCAVAELMKNKQQKSVPISDFIFQLFSLLISSVLMRYRNCATHTPINIQPITAG